MLNETADQKRNRILKEKIMQHEKKHLKEMIFKYKVLCFKILQDIKKYPNDKEFPKQLKKAQENYNSFRTQLKKLK